MAKAKDKFKHVEAGIKHARKIASGRLKQPKQVVWAVKRFVDWLDSGRYQFEPSLPEDICSFASKLPTPQGEESKMDLQAWQKMLISMMYGFVRPDGKRLVRETFIVVPRKNGKSTLAGILGLYDITKRKRRGGAVLFCGPTEKQAKHSYTQAQLIVNQSAPLRAAFEMTASARNIAANKTGGRMQSVSGNTSTIDGHIPTMICFDEPHAVNSPDALDLHRTSLASATDPMILLTTTAGDQFYSVATIERDHHLAVMRGDVPAADHRLGLMWEAELEDNPFSEKVWKRVCPNYGVSIKPEFYQQQAAEARRDEEKLKNFRTRQLCQWTGGTADVWIDREVWDEAEAPPPLEQAASRIKEFHIGLDLAEKFDLCSLCVAGHHENGEIWLWWRHWCPSRITSESGEHGVGLGSIGVRSMLAQWVEEGHILRSETEGMQIHPDDVVGEVVRIADLLKGALRNIVVDQFSGCGRMLEKLPDHLRAKVNELPKRAATFTSPCKLIEQLLQNGQLKISRDIVTAWAISNAVVDRRIDGSLLPKKEHRSSPHKIDPVDAMVLAVAAIDVGGSSTLHRGRGYKAPPTPESLGWNTPFISVEH